MSTILTEVYDAFVSAGVPDEARKAAEALSGHERRFDKLENTIDLCFAALKSEIDTRFAKVDGELLLLKWMTGFTLALVFATFAKQFAH